MKNNDQIVIIARISKNQRKWRILDINLMIMITHRFIVSASSWNYVKINVFVSEDQNI